MYKTIKAYRLKSENQITFFGKYSKRPGKHLRAMSRLRWHVLLRGFKVITPESWPGRPIPYPLLHLRSLIGWFAESCTVVHGNTHHPAEWVLKRGPYWQVSHISNHLAETWEVVFSTPHPVWGLGNAGGRGHAHSIVRPCVLLAPHPNDGLSQFLRSGCDDVMN